MWPFLLSLFSDLFLWTDPILKFFFLLCPFGRRIPSPAHPLLCFSRCESGHFCMQHHLQSYICLHTLSLFLHLDNLILLDRIFVISFSSSVKNCLIVKRGFFCLILLWNVPFCFLGGFFHTAVDTVNCTFAGTHVSAAYEAVGFLVVFPVYGLENISDGEDQLEGEQCQHTLLGFWSH